MKIYLIAAPLLFLAACDATPPQNVIEDVSANNMIADDVTEVQDESVPAAPVETENGVSDETDAANGGVVR